MDIRIVEVFCLLEVTLTLGVEIGFAVSIAESDYSDFNVKLQNREIIPKLHKKLPISGAIIDKINTLNLSYKGLNEQIFRSKKISKNKINKKIFFDNDNLILSDVKGNIIIYSTKEKKITKKFNFNKKTNK